MANYLYFQQDQGSLINRFSLENTLGDGYEINGRREWEIYTEFLFQSLYGDFTEDLRSRIVSELYEAMGIEANFQLDDGSDLGEMILQLLLIRLRQAAYSNSYRGRPCPRLFISHRQSDGLYALRMAQLASQNGFAFWVDILDPGLRILATNPGIPPKLIPLLTACIIEMALINCTHVLACMTPATRGTLWMPYEYGRITEIPGFYRRASAWCHPTLARTDYPEYMLLGETFNREKEIVVWLHTEKRHWPAGCSAPVKYNWNQSTFPPLPEGGNDDDYAELVLDFSNEDSLPIFETLIGSSPDWGVSDREDPDLRDEFIRWREAGLPIKAPLRIPKPLRLKKKNV